MDAKEARNKNLANVLDWLGFEKDVADKGQYKSGQHRISINGYAWFDHESGTGSGGAIDLVMHVNRISYGQAIELLCSMAGALPARTATQKPHVYLSPPPSTPENLAQVTHYLTHTRGIAEAIVSWCVDRGLIYADRYSNCVFRYGTNACEMRGTGAMQWRSARGEFTTGFFLPSKQCEGVALLESAIDAMSYRQLHKHHAAVSMAGNSNDTIMNNAVIYAASKRLPVIAAFDNDRGGAVATAQLAELANRHRVEFLIYRPCHFKDWNEELLKA